MIRLRLYADTSVFGGCFDDEFEELSRKLFDEVRAERFLLLLSETVLEELREAPDEVRRLAQDLKKSHFELIDLTPEVRHLRDAYLGAGVVGPASLLDAEHIASATVARADLIVSWNFRHIVHFEKIRGYNSVNLLRGYPTIDIRSPREVV